MNLNVSKLEALALDSKNVVSKDNCMKVKGGGWYYCCGRNKWIQY